MIHQELLQDLTESFLKSLIAEASDSGGTDLDSFTPFRELGIHSLHVLRIIKRLESDFGTLPKSLLFENININDLANYFVRKHEQALSIKFAAEMQEANSHAHSNGRQLKTAETGDKAKPTAASGADAIMRHGTPICILETKAWAHPELREVVQTLFSRYRMDGGVSRGARKIAPNLFIGSARRGYFNYGRSKNIILVYSYTGPRDYLPVLLEEMYQYCTSKTFQLNILADEEIASINGISLSATPFGVIQRIVNLKKFTLGGGAMRHLRYQVAKFKNSGSCKTEEYRCGTHAETNREIAGVIDAWCQSKTVVNPLVRDVKEEILAGTLSPEHRLFLTYLDGVLQNVILVTAMSGETKGYLMDLEFYLPDMPMGGLEFAIVQIIDILVAEGCDVLSLGGTYGCKLHSSTNEDPEIDRILDDLRKQNIFNEEGNFQFKNKFRPENKIVFLCRPAGSGNTDNVVDIIMMIADPEKMQQPDEESHDLSRAQRDDTTLPKAPEAHPPASSEFIQASCGPAVIEGNARSRVLTQFGFNPLNVPHEQVEFDLKTDSWAQLKMPAIDAQMRHLQAQLQQPVSIDDTLRAVFPFAHFVLTASGYEAEHLFFKAWPQKGAVPQNLLFPSTIFHQIDNGFTTLELPHPAVFDLNSHEKYKGNMNWEALQAQVAQSPDAIAFVCIEANDNAAGGYPLSLQHLSKIKSLLVPHSIPLVIDGTRVVENAQFLMEQEPECANKSLWTVVREIFSCADAVIGSLTKDFCVSKGGIIATNDSKLLHRIEELVRREGNRSDLIDKKMIALALQDRKQIEAKVSSRMASVRLIWQALKEHNVPIVEPAGGHCVLIDVKQIPEFKGFKDPVASFVAWLYLSTGICAGAHSVGMQKHTRINDLVRLAIPVGLKREQIDSVIARLIHAFENKADIPEIVTDNNALQTPGTVHAKYKLVKYHKVSENVSSLSPSEPTKIAAAQSSASASLPASTERPQGASVSKTVVQDHQNHASEESEANQMTASRKLRQRRDIAIVGMAGRYPKAKNVSELWENLAQSRDCIEEIPADRYERRLQHGSVEKYRGGFIDAVDKFDSLFFNISPREAEMLDPQERLFLEVAWEAIEDAGYYPEILSGSGASRNIGVFVGAVWAMYQILGVEENDPDKKVTPNSFLWSIANRVSYWMNLCGPSMTVDTACSSSLTTIYLACEAIQAGECSAAIAGGVNLDLHQAKFDINRNGGALSADGICRSFGKGANGYVAGEGVGALFLKPLEQAVKDGDNIYGVIKSAVVNHGGRTSGYTVPNPKAQTSLIVSALEKANVQARTLGYIEAHGTGTELGDPIEISGLSQAFSEDKIENQSCAIGSIKSNIGHLEAAAGVASVSKVLLQMNHRQLVPSLHSSQLNEFIDFKNSPFHVVQGLSEWKAKEVDGVQLPLRAGISSFGAGGANAHIIVEEYKPIQQVNDEPSATQPLIFSLSARNEDQLRETAVRLSRFLERNRANLSDVAYTLQYGRKSFDHRLAIIAKTKEELLEKLACFMERKNGEDILQGHVKNADNITRLLSRKEKEEFIRLLSQGRDLCKLAELWVEGLLADWSGFEPQTPGKRISLPTYPFADKRHWVCKKSSTHLLLQPAAGIHPLVDTNESTFERQLFKKTFHERDFFIYDHHVAGVPTLPGVAYLELVRKAGEIAGGRKVQKIKNILWVSPITVQNAKPKEVFIELKPGEATVRFEVFSNDAAGNKVLHSQGTLLYATKQDITAKPEYVDLEHIRARCAKVIDGKNAYRLFQSFGLALGPSFQVLQEVYKNGTEALGILKLPEFRHADLINMVLHPSLIDGSLQAGMGAQLGDKAEELLVPYSIGEVEILHPLQPDCFSYVTEAKEDKKEKKEKSRLAKSNVLIVDQAGKVLIKIRESTGVPLQEVHKKSTQHEDADRFSKLYYSYEWEKASPDKEAAKQNSVHSILFFHTDDQARELYQERLREAGTSSAQVILVRPGAGFQDLYNQSYTVNPESKGDFGRLFESLAERNCPIENICFAWPTVHADSLDENLLRESLERGIYSFLFVCQSIIKQKLESKVQLLYVYAARPGELQLHNEAVSGFVNTLRVEHPKLPCKTLEIRRENGGDSQIVDAVWAEFQMHTHDATAVRYEAQERSIKKLKAFDLKEDECSVSQGVALREKGVYLITGGAGELGLIFAEFLAKEYNARLVLTGRSSLSAERKARFSELQNSGAEVLYLPADVSRYEDVRNLVDKSKSHFGKINGVIHAAGVLRDSYIRNKTPEEMSAVFAPKVYGTLHLDEATKDEALDFFVTFSSLASVAGNAGQCDYSFANYFMDAFAAGRELLRAKGTRSGKTLSINWSLWADGGMKPDEQTEIYFKKTLGMKPLSAATGLDAFVKGLASGRSQFAVLEGEQEKIESAWGLRKKEAKTSTLTASASPALSIQATAAPIPGEKDGGLLALLQNDLSQIVMEFLKLEASDVSPDKILLDLGFDSIGLTTFANAINDKYQLDITPVLFFDYPSIGEIANHLFEERKGEICRFYRSTSAVATAPPATLKHSGKGDTGSGEPAFQIHKGWNPAALDEEGTYPHSNSSRSSHAGSGKAPIAIVGISGVMPQSENLEEFWENLKNSKDMISVIPKDRWNWEDYYGDPLKAVNKSNSKWGGFMKEIDKFDPLFFGISEKEAQMMDPQQRIFLETVWRAIEDSGQKVSDLSGTKTGVFVGVATTDYRDLMNGQQIGLDGYTASGNSHCVLANRVSFLLNLRGPSAPIDTACSSSLIALHRAVESIHMGNCDMAIVGGVQVMLSPAGHISFSMAGMLSSDGKCRPFDKRANGYVRGEGAGAILLKPLSAAQADGNHIYAIVRATAENHSGRAIALTAPSSSAQSALLMEEYEKAQIEPETIGYIECHGTGTSLGDPVEIQALNKAFSEIHKSHNKTPAKTAYCGLSSLKSNIGHLETAAGVASLLKVVLAIKHKQIPASIHFEEINPFIDLKGTPFYVVNKLTPWEAATDEHGLPLPRRAGVSCFGFGGANAHIVLEEYIPPARQSLPQAKDPQLIVLSAKNEKRLNAYVQLMRTYLEKEEIELIDFAYTLQVGRDEMPERLAWVVSSKEELKQKIDNILRGGDAPKDNYRNNTNKDSKSRVVDGGEGETLVRDLIKQKELSKLAELWVSGVKIAWRSLYDSDVPNRISIPTYPFARERYWFPSAERNAVEKQSHHGRMAAESLPAKNAAKDAAPQPSTEQPSVVTTRQAAPMTAEAKMELLLKQEVALQLPGPVDAISISLTYFDLGLGSLGIMNLVHKINELLQESLPISVVFEYRNIESLAAYLAATYPAKVAGLAVNIEEEVTQYSEDSAKATRLPEENYFLARPAPSLHEQTDATTARYEIADKQVLERLWWHEKSLDESYEKVTF